MAALSFWYGGGENGKTTADLRKVELSFCGTTVEGFPKAEGLGNPLALLVTQTEKLFQIGRSKHGEAPVRGGAFSPCPLLLAPLAGAWHRSKDGAGCFCYEDISQRRNK